MNPSKKVEPTYLRFAIIGLKSSQINNENPSSLPNGLIGLYEGAFSLDVSTANRSLFLQNLALWAIFRRPISISLMASVSGINETETKSFVTNHSKWFNSTESGRYELYHERLKNFLISKLSQTDFEELNVKLLRNLRSKELSSELLMYRFHHYVDHLISVCMLNDNFKEELNIIVYNDEHWDSGFLELKSTTAGIENVRNLISYSVYSADWKMLHRCTEVILFLRQKNDKLCEEIIFHGNFDSEQIEFCFDSIPSDFERLRFLSLLTLSIIQKDDKNNELEWIKILWGRLSHYVHDGHPNWALVLPFWAIPQLRDFGLVNQIDALSKGLNEVNLTNIYSTNNREHKFPYFHDDLSEFSIQDKKTFKLLRYALDSQESEFIKIFRVIDTPNLMDRDELICRATEICVEQNHQSYTDWLFWLIVESDFEVGEHAPPDEKHYTKNLIGKYLQVCNKDQLIRIEQLVTAADLLQNIKMELRCWISDKYKVLHDYEKAIAVLNQFQYEIESTFKAFPWKIAWMRENKTSLDYSECRPNDKIEILLNFSSLSSLEFCEIDSLLKDLNHDRISKAEYFAEISLRLLEQNPDLAKRLICAAWELVAKTKDWASIHVKAELLATSLQIMEQPWVESKLKTFKKDFDHLIKDHEFLSMALDVFYKYKPTRFNSRNLLPLVSQNKALHAFLKKVNSSAFTTAIQDEKNELHILYMARYSKNLREFWLSVKRYFLIDGVGRFIENFWSIFKTNNRIFEDITAEDIRIIAVISRKVGQHFPIDLHLNKSPKLELYKNRISIPNDWEYAAKKGFPALLSNKTSNIEELCSGILNGPRIDNELDQVSRNAVAYLLHKSMGNKNLVKDISSFVKLKIEVNSTSIN